MIYRTHISLDGDWLFQVDPENHSDWQTITAWRTASVPLPWQAQFDDLRHYRGAAWYRRQFDLAEAPAGSAILHFGAVDYQATVWLNGQQVGEHEGGYLPFEFEIAPLLQAGHNEVVVKVIDPDDNRDSWPDYPFSEIPHGKQSWYGPIGGIWQNVWLEFRFQHHLHSLRLTPDANTGLMTCTVKLNALPAAKATQIHLQVADPAGKIVAEHQLADTTEGYIQLEPSDLALWSHHTPNLYTVTATLWLDGRPVDQLSQSCGFRTVEARDGRIYLNGQPIYLRGVLDQAYYPETIYTPPSLAFLEEQLRQAKSLGLNCLRCHIKIEDPRYYEVADRLGMLIWTEIPNWDRLSPQAAARAKETFRQMVERDWHHPSIVAWTLINENWGTDLVHNPEHRRWLAEFYQEAKTLDPTRLIVDNSACCDNFHVAGDLDDFHHYRAIPDHLAEWDGWVAAFASRPDWAWARDYSQHRRADLPLIVSEFGNWGLPHPDNLREQGREPWWFETGSDRNEGIVYPHGFRERFEALRLEQVFGSFDEFIAAHQRHMALSLAYEIASMRLHPAIGGYVITEFTDVHWECNGLLDMQRHVKQHLDNFVAINQDRAVVIRPSRWSGRPGEALPVNIQAFDLVGPGQGGQLRWQAGSATGVISLPGAVVEIVLPGHEPAGLLAIQAQWQAGDGTLLAQNQVEVAYAQPVISPQKLHVVDDLELAQTLKDLGYTVVDDPNTQAAVLISRQYPADLPRAMQQGKSFLLLLGPGTTSPENGIRTVGRVVARAGSLWQGDWATSFSWLRKNGAFAALPGSPLLGLAYAEMMPEAVITDLPEEILQEHSWAGLALGWLHKTTSLLIETSSEQGRCVATTFKLTSATLSNNVLAQNLFSGILDSFFVLK